MIAQRLAPFAASALCAFASAQDRRDVSVTPISGPLGLADITVRITDPSLQPQSVQVFAPGGERLTVPLLPAEPGVWTTRIIASPRGDGDALRIAVTFQTPQGLVDGPVHEISTTPTHPTPDWAKGAVWYQVFPERFANGDPANDPVSPEFFNASWRAPWHAVTPAELETHWAAVESLGSPPGPPYHWGGRVFRRRYGGDLQGLVQRLDHLQNLGVTAIYICPIFQSGSLHRYDADDHRHVDASLGPAGTPPRPAGAAMQETAHPFTWQWTPADRYFLDVLLPAAHSRGMKVILDGVWNHVGRGHWAFLDALERGRSSPFADWFDLRFDETGAVIGWGAWDRPNGNLPEFRRGADGNLVEPVRRHIADITRRWMDPNGDGDPADGIDGWRLDVAAEIPHDFWREWHALVRSINPEALTVAEIWFPADAWLEGDQFDAQMNYPFGMTAAAWLNGAPRSTADTASERLHDIFSIRPAVALVQMNLITSHDTERLASFLANRREFNTRSRPGAGGYREGPIDDATADRVELAFALMATAPGSPMIYNGDEFAMWGAGDPHNRRPIPWPDLATPTPDNLIRPEMPQRIAGWLQLRSDPRYGPVLRYGAVHMRESGQPQVIVFERQLNATRLLVILNASDEPFEAAAFAPDAQPAVPPRSARWFDLTSE